MTDYRNPDPRLRDIDPAAQTDPRFEAAGPSATWGWIAGAVILAIVLVAIVSWSGSDTRATGPTMTPPATTSQGPAAPPARTPAPPSTTGQGAK